MHFAPMQMSLGSNCIKWAGYSISAGYTSAPSREGLLLQQQLWPDARLHLSWCWTESRDTAPPFPEAQPVLYTDSIASEVPKSNKDGPETRCGKHGKK